MSKTPKPLPPVDANVKIPAAVKAAAARADAAYAAPPEVIPPAAQEVVPPVAPVVEVVPPVAPVAPAPVQTNDWEHKFNSMKGRFERADTVNRELTQRLAGMEATVAAMTAPPVVPELRASSLVTSKEREDYGTEFLDVAARAASERISPEVQELRATVDGLNKQVKSLTGNLVQDARTKMHDALNVAVPNWLAINETEAFLNWLALSDPYSGAIRHDLLKAAYAACDAPRVAVFFKGFLTEEAALAPQPEPAPKPALPAQNKVPLEQFTAPGRAKSAASASTVPAEKPVFTRADITKFYADVTSGKYRGRDDDKNKLERAIHEAGREGRIQ